VKPHKVRYYLEQRDPDFAEKMAEVLCVYRQVKILKQATSKTKRPSKPVAIISYDEKPGLQAIATTALLAGTPWLDVFCPGCGTSRAIDLRTVDRHPLASVGTLVLGLRCSWCPGSAPMPKLLGLGAARARAW
jgi:hypothetical protein